jgi:P-type E1-E2 ATPase
MIELSIPGQGVVRLNHLVCDVNGTLALDGVLIEGVAEAIGRLRDRLQIHLITADTHGRQHEIDVQLKLNAVRLLAGGERERKAAYIRQLGAGQTAAIGQGANDSEMLRTAVVGIAVMSREGLNVEALVSADLVVPDILAALELFEKPMRMVASLRK